MIFHWNVASTRFDYCYYYAEKYMQQSGNYHIKSDGLVYDIIDLDNGKRLLPEIEARGVLVKAFFPQIFEPAEPHQFITKPMENPFDELRPCVTFKDMDIRSDIIPIIEILDELEKRLAEPLIEDKCE